MQRGGVFEAVHQPDRDFVEAWAPGDSGGGVEAGRIRVPDGPLANDSFASAQPSSGDAVSPDSFSLPSALFHPGENVIAVEVRQIQALRDREKITWPFGGSAAWPWARREEGASPSWGCARRATTPKARRRPAPEGWGDFGFWLRCSSVIPHERDSFVAPRQKPKSPPAKPEVSFERTLNPFATPPFHDWVKSSVTEFCAHSFAHAA
jgi:hypothetical protein